MNQHVWQNTQTTILYNCRICIYSDNNETFEKLGRDDTVDVSATNGLGALKSRGLHPALVFLPNHRFVKCSLWLNLLTEHLNGSLSKSE